MFRYSEFEMGISFGKALHNSKIPYLKFPKNISTEMISKQGIPDFVIVGCREGKLINMRIEFSSTESSCRALSVLKYFSGRTFSYVKRAIGQNDYICNKTLRELEYLNLIKKQKGLYYLVYNELLDKDIWAFELKLGDWKRSLFQAMQYLAFANYSVVVFPFEKEKVLLTQLRVFEKFNIGVLLFNIEDNKNKWLYRPKKSRPLSKWQYYDMLIKVNNDAYLELATEKS
ncbi:MAG: hypothetical protein SOV56_04380 [Phascolarctobacterium sp.]|nr:hypothetical protein [Phascolarctobacterium sp.]